MIYDVNMRVDIATPQKAAAVRDKLAAYARNDPDVTLIDFSASRATHVYRVWGVDVSTSIPFDETVEAVDEETARAMYSNPKIIAAIRGE